MNRPRQAIDWSKPLPTPQEALAKQEELHGITVESSNKAIIAYNKKNKDSSTMSWSSQPGFAAARGGAKKPATKRPATKKPAAAKKPAAKRPATKKPAAAKKPATKKH